MLTFSTSCFYCLEMRFLVLEYHKTHFPGLYCLKKNMQKWPVFDQNHGLTPLEKSQFFDFFNFLFLLSRNAFFSFRISKTHISGLYCLKKNSEKWPIFQQNHGLTPLEKCQFFDFFNFLFLLPRKAFFRSRIS